MGSPGLSARRFRLVPAGRCVRHSKNVRGWTTLPLRARRHREGTDLATWRRRSGSTSWHASSASPTKKRSTSVFPWVSASRATPRASRTNRPIASAARPTGRACGATCSRRKSRGARLPTRPRPPLLCPAWRHPPPRSLRRQRYRLPLRLPLARPCLAHPGPSPLGLRYRRLPLEGPRCLRPQLRPRQLRLRRLRQLRLRRSRPRSPVLRAHRAHPRLPRQGGLSRERRQPSLPPVRRPGPRSRRQPPALRPPS